MKAHKLLCTALLLGGLWAQERAFRVGVALLPQNTWLLNQDDSDAGPELDYEVTWGFAGGLSASYHFSDYIGVGLDVLYSRQGQKYKGTVAGTAYTAQTNLNYLRLPLLLRFSTDPEAPVQFNAFLGPQLSLLLSYQDKVQARISTQEVSGTTITTTITGMGSSTENLDQTIYKKSLFGGVFGLGMGIRAGESILITIHFRGDYAFGDAENKEAKILHTGHTGNYWENKPKYGGSVVPVGYKRPNTTAVTGGFQLGVYYTIGGR